VIVASSYNIKLSHEEIVKDHVKLQLRIVVVDGLSHLKTTGARKKSAK
jgi:hypothetical protein